MFDGLTHHPTWPSDARRVSEATIELHGGMTYAVGSMYAPSLVPGTLLAGEWHVDGFLGEGGLATVVAATGIDGQRAAVKVLHPKFRRDTDVRRRFSREGYVSLAIVHPTVVRILGEGETEDGRPFLVMELLEGGTLRELKMATPSKTLHPVVIIDALIATLEGLEAVHQKGIIHRDLKPDNLFVLQTGGVKILDFGIARVNGIATLSRPQQQLTGEIVLGTPGYLAPEQAKGAQEVDARADLFSLGATAFVLLTGKRLYPGSTPVELWMAAANTRVDPIREVDSSVPTALAAVVDRALAYEPADRWKDAREMREALRIARAALVATEEVTDGKTLPRLMVSGFEDAPTLLDAGTYGACVSRAVEAFERGDVPRAVDLFDRAARSREREPRALIGLAESCLWAGDAERAEGAAREAFAIASPDTQHHVDAGGMLCWAMLRTESPNAVAVLERVTATLSRDPALAPHPEALTAMLVLARRRAARAADRLVRELIAREESGPRAKDPLVRGSMLRARSWVASFDERLGEAAALAREAVQVLRDGGAELSAARASQYLGSVLSDLGAYHEAASHYRAALRTARRRGLGWLARFTEYALATPLRRLGDLDAALALEMRAIEWATADGDQAALLQARLDLARILYERGDYADAAAELDEVLARTVTVHLRGIALTLLGGIALARGECATAMVRTGEALETISARSPESGLALAQLLHARACLATGDRERAVATVAAGCARIWQAASSIQEEELRRSFLNIAEHKGLLDLELRVAADRAPGDQRAEVGPETRR